MLDRFYLDILKLATVDIFTNINIASLNILLFSVVNAIYASLSLIGKKRDITLGFTDANLRSFNDFNIYPF